MVKNEDGAYKRKLEPRFICPQIVCSCKNGGGFALKGV